MELYNFFTEPIKDEKLIEELHYCMVELIPICYNVQLVYHNGYFSIIGQMLGDDTNVGDMQLLIIFKSIKYTWFDAFCPNINNLNQ